jgi:hypothetical protein
LIPKTLISIQLIAIFDEYFVRNGTFVSSNINGDALLSTPNNTSLPTSIHANRSINSSGNNPNSNSLNNSSISNKSGMSQSSSSGGQRMIAQPAKHRHRVHQPLQHQPTSSLMSSVNGMLNSNMQMKHIDTNTANGGNYLIRNQVLVTQKDIRNKNTGNSGNY